MLTPCNNWCSETRGRVRTGLSLQLGTMSTRIANLLCIIHSALSRLSCRAYARHTHSDLAALCRYSADRQTDTRQTRLTNQPTGQQPFCQYPAVKWEFIEMTKRRMLRKFLVGKFGTLVGQFFPLVRHMPHLLNS